MRFIDGAYEMKDSRLEEILSKFRMPKDEYSVLDGGEFGESEFYWVIEGKNSHERYLLVNSYWHPSLDEEMTFYRDKGFDVKKPIFRDPESFEASEDTTDSRIQYLYLFLYEIFEL